MVLLFLIPRSVLASMLLFLQLLMPLPPLPALVPFDCDGDSDGNAIAPFFLVGLV